MFQKYKRKIIFSVVLGALVFLALSIYANFDNLVLAFSDFNWILFPIILALSFCNYIARFFKWEYYTKVLNFGVERKVSFLIFLSSFIMSVTPGKLGEVFKSFLLKEHNGTPISKSAPIVFAERLTDFLSLILLSIIGAVMFQYGTIFLIIAGAVFILIIVVLSSKKLCYSIIVFFERFRFFSKISVKIHAAYDSIYQMLKLKQLTVAILLSLIAWLFECVGFYLVINSFGIANFIYIDIFVATFIYGFSTILGAVTMLPGGLGATDAAITGLLVLIGISKNVSVASTMIIRVATLWFAVIVGIIAVLYYQKFTNKKLSEIALEV